MHTNIVSGKQIRLSLTQLKELSQAHTGKYSTADVAAMWSISEDSVRKLVETGRLTDRRFTTHDGRKIGNLRFKEDDLARARRNCQVVQRFISA